MFLETTPDTSNYMILGYVLAFAVMGIYVFSMYLRAANLKRDIETLESIQVESKPKAKKITKVKTSAGKKATKKK